MPACLLLSATFVILTAESGMLIGVLLPGASLLAALGVVTQLGIVPLSAALGTAFLATVLGAHLRFVRTGSRQRAIARARAVRSPPDTTTQKAGTNSPSLLARWRSRVHSVSTIELAPSWRGRPRTLVMIGHWVGGLRTVAPGMAATQGVTYRKFAGANAASAAGWVGSFILAGNALAEHADQITRIAPALGLPLIAVVLVLRWVRRRLSSRHTMGLAG